MSLWDAYPIVGSYTGRIGYTYGYRLLTGLPLEYNGRDYSAITDYDIMCKIMNAIPGDVIEYTRIMNECSPYAELIRRRCIETLTTAATTSGCFTGGVDKEFYRDYEIDCMNRLIEHVPYIGPTDVKNMGTWPKLKPIMTKDEYYHLITWRSKKPL